MRVIKLLIVSLSFVTMLQGCTFPFEPDIEGIEGDLVIQGRLTDQEGYQYIEVSRTILLSSLEDISPVIGCTVSIQDEHGNVFVADEKNPGLYASWIQAEFLTAGTRYQLLVTTPDSRNYASDYAELLPCPPIDSINWERKEELTNDPELTYEGVRFYVNTNAGGESPKNFRWELVETWEYHSAGEIRAYYNGGTDTFDIIVPNPDPGAQFSYFTADSLYFCWKSRTIPDIYTYSTQNLAGGLVRKFPLHHVSNETDRLSFKYHLLVRQYSLTATAYNYWKIVEDQSKQSGELYETQPARITGNIHSMDDPGESVIGLFYATSVQEKSIYARPLIPTYRNSCYFAGFSNYDLINWLSRLRESQYPVWLAIVDSIPGWYKFDFVAQDCFDCRLKGGSLIRPDFWE